MSCYSYAANWAENSQEQTFVDEWQRHNPTIMEAQ